MIPSTTLQRFYQRVVLLAKTFSEGKTSLFLLFPFLRVRTACISLSVCFPFFLELFKDGGENAGSLFIACPQGSAPCSEFAEHLQ